MVRKGSPVRVRQRAPQKAPLPRGFLMDTLPCGFALRRRWKHYGSSRASDAIDRRRPAPDDADASTRVSTEYGADQHGDGLLPDLAARIDMGQEREGRHGHRNEHACRGYEGLAELISRRSST